MTAPDARPAAKRSTARNGERAIPFLVSPRTREQLERIDGFLVDSGGDRYVVRDDGKIDFLGLRRRDDLRADRDFLDRMKAAVKGLLGRWYVLLVNVIAPVMPRLHFSTFETYASYVIRKLAVGRPLVIQIGSGNDRLGSEIVNIDIFDFPEVDVIADCTCLPFAESSVDGVISMAVLEHVPNPEDFLKEASRVLKPGGFIVTGVPFMQGFHASPNDYYRWTGKGLEVVHQRWGFSMVSIDPIGGPTSSLLWIFQEWLAVLLSFGIGPLYYFWWVILTLTLFPLKVADLALMHYGNASKISSFNMYVGRKAAPPPPPA
jgi:SAM-dependent methyltransferase